MSWSRHWSHHKILWASTGQHFTFRVTLCILFVLPSPGFSHPAQHVQNPSNWSQIPELSLPCPVWHTCLTSCLKLFSGAPLCLAENIQIFEQGQFTRRPTPPYGLWTRHSPATPGAVPAPSCLRPPSAPALPEPRLLWRCPPSSHPPSLFPKASPTQ